MSKLEIVGLYEYNDVYQVVDSEESVLHQGSRESCECYQMNNCPVAQAEAREYEENIQW